MSRNNGRHRGGLQKKTPMRTHQPTAPTLLLQIYHQTHAWIRKKRRVQSAARTSLASRKAQLQKVALPGYMRDLKTATQKMRAVLPMKTTARNHDGLRSIRTVGAIRTWTLSVRRKQLPPLAQEGRQMARLAQSILATRSGTSRKMTAFLSGGRTFNTNSFSPSLQTTTLTPWQEVARQARS